MLAKKPLIIEYVYLIKTTAAPEQALVVDAYIIMVLRVGEVIFPHWPNARIFDYKIVLKLLVVKP